MKNRWVRTAILLIGVPAIALAGWYAYGDIQDLDAPPLWALLPAAAANLVSLWCSSRSWEVLFGPAVERRVLEDAFYTSQLMKYTPVGGVAQAVGQAALARTDEVGTARAGTAMLVSKLTMVIGGSVFGPLLAIVNPDLPTWARLGLLLTPAALLFGRRGLLARVLDQLRRILPRTPDQTVLPSQREVWTSVAWAVPGLGFAGVSFAALAVPAGIDVSFTQATVGFAVAWVVGFLVIPVPSGLGVREASLGLLVGGDPGAKLVAAVLFRAVAIVTELLLFGRVRLMARRRRPHSIGRT
jgi:hypothetical protein